MLTSEGNTLYCKSLGYRTFDDEEKAPLQGDSVMWIASLTKLVTAIACMIAVESGFVTLDQNVREIVPELGDVEVLLGFEEGEAPRKPITKKTDASISLRLVTIPNAEDRANSPKTTSEPPEWLCVRSAKRTIERVVSIQ